MAGDWIKMRCALQHDPKVIAIGRFVEALPAFSPWLSSGTVERMPISDGALRYIVTGALHVTWSVANEHAKSGVIEGATLEWIDLVTGIPGFGRAMQSVGWAKIDDGSLLFPKFDYNNTSSAERVRKWREKQRAKCNVTGNVTEAVTSNVTVRAREEKRRIDKNVSSKEETGRSRPPRFVAPTVDQVREYCQSRGNSINPEQFVDHYTANGWVQGKSGKPIKDWQAAVRTWERNEFGAKVAPPIHRIGTREDAKSYSAYGAAE